jgi:hypothetical protein
LKKLFWIFIVLFLVFTVGCFEKTLDILVDVSGKYRGHLKVTKLESVGENGWLGHSTEVLFLVTQENETMTLTFIKEQENEENNKESDEELEEEQDDKVEQQEEISEEEEVAYDLILGDSFTGSYDAKEGIFTYEFAKNVILTMTFTQEENETIAQGILVFNNQEVGVEDEITIELERVENLK